MYYKEKEVNGYTVTKLRD